MDKMKNLQNLLNQLKVAKKYNNKSRVVGLLLEIVRYEEPKAQADLEKSQVAVTIRHYSYLLGILIEGLNKDIAKAEKEAKEEKENQTVVSPAREKACKIAHEIFMAYDNKQKVRVAQKLRIWGSGPQVCWVVDIFRRNIGWVTTAIEQGVLPTNARFIINHQDDLSQLSLINPAVEF